MIAVLVRFGIALSIAVVVYRLLIVAIADGVLP